MKNYLIVGMVVLILVISAVQSFQLNSIKNELGTKASSTSSDSAGGETYEQMMARMHPDQVQSQPVQVNSQPQMVGGC